MVTKSLREELDEANEDREKLNKEVEGKSSELKLLKEMNMTLQSKLQVHFSCTVTPYMLLGSFFVLPTICAGNF